VVSDGEAMTVSVYDPKAVQYLEMTFLCGWWAELGIPPLKSMTISGLGGVAGNVKNAQGRLVSTVLPTNSKYMAMKLYGMRLSFGTSCIGGLTW